LRITDAYEISTLQNENLHIESGDTYETAFGKIEKAV